MICIEVVFKCVFSDLLIFKRYQSIKKACKCDRCVFCDFRRMSADLHARRTSKVRVYTYENHFMEEMILTVPGK